MNARIFGVCALLFCGSCGKKSSRPKLSSRPSVRGQLHGGVHGRCVNTRSCMYCLVWWSRAAHFHLAASFRKMHFVGTAWYACTLSPRQKPGPFSCPPSSCPVPAALDIRVCRLAGRVTPLHHRPAAPSRPGGVDHRRRPLDQRQVYPPDAGDAAPVPEGPAGGGAQARPAAAPAGALTARARLRARVLFCCRTASLNGLCTKVFFVGKITQHGNWPLACGFVGDGFLCWFVLRSFHPSSQKVLLASGTLGSVSSQAAVCVHAYCTVEFSPKSRRVRC